MSYTPEPSSLLREGEALIIVPPFFLVDQPSLAAHLLQSCAGQAGFRVSVLYANILLASAIGVEVYNAFCSLQGNALIGERLFARSAHGLEPLGNGAVRIFDPSTILGKAKADQIGSVGLVHTPEERRLSLSKLEQLEAMIPSWAEEIAAAMTRLPFQVVGCTNSFEQTNSSIALLKGIKRRRPGTVTIMGGANCDGEMAEGMASLDPAGEWVDYIFSGESEATFPRFLQEFYSGQPAPGRIVYGQPCRDLDALPTPDYTEYFDQLSHYLPDVEGSWLAYETSRGCWWGQKHHCTFCGVNGEGMGFRQKSPNRVLADLRSMVETYPTRQVRMADNIMPYSYFQTLIPRLADELPRLEIFYEQKANLSLANVLALKKAGISSIQPGIEALSSPVLKRMDKGVLARQNIMLLRYAGSVGLRLSWNLLWGFPGDELQTYEQTLALLPLMRHFQPPFFLIHLSLERFSPYFDRPEAYGVNNLRPIAPYAAVLPPHADVEKLAYHFVGDYECAAYQNPDVMRQIGEEVADWQNCWLSGPDSIPILQVTHSGNIFLLADTRGLPGTQPLQILDRAQAAIALTARPYTPTLEIAWALEHKLGVLVDGWYVPLATAKPDLLFEFEAEVKRRGHVLCMTME
jgi:ribosomal peptide maturation radical SAM protein 1